MTFAASAAFGRGGPSKHAQRAAPVRDAGGVPPGPQLHGQLPRGGDAHASSSQTRSVGVVARAPAVVRFRDRAGLGRAQEGRGPLAAAGTVGSAHGGPHVLGLPRARSHPGPADAPRFAPRKVDAIGLGLPPSIVSSARPRALVVPSAGPQNSGGTFCGPIGLGKCIPAALIRAIERSAPVGGRQPGSSPGGMGSGPAGHLITGLCPGAPPIGRSPVCHRHPGSLASLIVAGNCSSANGRVATSQLVPALALDVAAVTGPGASPTTGTVSRILFLSVIGTVTPGLPPSTPAIIHSSFNRASSRGGLPHAGASAVDPLGTGLVPFSLLPGGGGATGGRGPGRGALAAPSRRLGTAGGPGTATPGTLAPGTAAGAYGGTAATTRARGTGAHRSHVAPVLPPPTATGNVIERFVNVVPTWVWLAIGGSLALAAVGAGVALSAQRRFRRQAGRFAAISAAALTDPLTGVLNRRGFTEAVERELARAHRYNRPFVLAYVDVRGLKGVNDTEGHLAGDRLLRGVASMLEDTARADDVVGRLGGDELGLLLVEQTAAGAAVVTHRIQEKVPQQRAAMGIRAPWDLTVGSAAFPDDGKTLDQLLAAADRRLYRQRGISLL